MPSNTPPGKPASPTPDRAYAPVACVFHERLEFAVLRGLELDLTWSDAGGTQRDRVRPFDVYTRDGAEWLAFHCGDGAEAAVRLDLIQAMQEYPRTVP